MSKKLEGKVAVVTGAGSGMGKAIAQAYFNEGAKVMLADINDGALIKASGEIDPSGVNVKTVVANVAKEDDIKNMIAKTVTEFGAVDILVNNAGIVDNITTVGNMSDELWQRVLDINLTGPFMACREAVKIMEKQDNGGNIINIASVGGLYGSRGGVAYTATKHGLIGITKNIAATYGRFGNIRANAIAPGNVATNIQSTVVEPDQLGITALKEAGGFNAPVAEPEKIAAVAVFLASADSSFVNGDVITADGGWSVL